MKLVTIVKDIECAMPDCDNMFPKSRANRKYCSQRCGKRAHRHKLQALHKKNYTGRPKKEHICQYRECGETFMSSFYNAKYCCDDHNKKERYERKRDKDNPNRKRYNGAIAKVKVPYINDKFSTKWMQELWDKRKEKERV